MAGTLISTRPPSVNQNELNHQEWENTENWSLGFYFSKRDSRVWVPKHPPWMGWTPNIGQHAGAAWLLGFLIGLPILLLACFIFLPTNFRG